MSAEPQRHLRQTRKATTRACRLSQVKRQGAENHVLDVVEVPGEGSSFGGLKPPKAAN